MDYVCYHTSPHSLLPGTELFSDRFRCDPSQFLSCLGMASRELVQRRHSMLSLPLLFLYEHVAHSVVRDVFHTVAARTLRVRALAHLSLYAAAMKQMQDLLYGVHISVPFAMFDRNYESQGGLTRFDDKLSLTNAANIKAISTVIDKELSPTLAELYGFGGCLEVGLAQAELLVLLALSCNEIPPERVTTFPGDPNPPGGGQHVQSPKPGKVVPPSSPPQATPASSLEKGTKVESMKLKRNGMSRSEVKHCMLKAAEQMLLDLHLQARQQQQQQPDG